jgi:hypothetical protein
MPRKDYDEIKRRFETYIATWKSKKEDTLTILIIPEVKIRFSISHNKDGRMEGLDSIQQFVSDFPATDYLQLAIYNFACRIRGAEAQQYAHVVCTALNEVEGQEELDVFYFVAMSCNHWIKTATGWKMDEMKMDVLPLFGNLQPLFEEKWYLGSFLIRDAQPEHLPCIIGELDSPWERVKEAEDVLTDEEKVKECVIQRFFGGDHLMWNYVLERQTQTVGANTCFFRDNDGLRAGTQALKYKRQKDRYWAHTYRFEKIEIQGDRAFYKGNRVCGYAQRNHEYIWTRQNADIEHACSQCRMELIREKGVWKIASSDVKYGLFEVGRYDDGLYRDKV